jgi:hypothetical protein
MQYREIKVGNEYNIQPNFIFMSASRQVAQKSGSLPLGAGCRFRDSRFIFEAAAPLEAKAVTNLTSPPEIETVTVPKCVLLWLYLTHRNRDTARELNAYFGC